MLSFLLLLVFGRFGVALWWMVGYRIDEIWNAIMLLWELEEFFIIER